MTCIDKKGLLTYLYKDFKFLIGLIVDIPFRIIKYIIDIKTKIFKHDKHCIKNRKGAKPILLIHGYGGHSIQWVPISWFYLKQFDIYTINISFNSHLTLLNINIENKITQIYEETGMKVNLIGHSMGGLVASKYINHSKVNNIITIATPFRGTPLLNYFKFENNCINDIQKKSEFLNILHSNIQKEKKTIHCFGSHYDIYVPYPRYLPYYCFNDYHIKLSGHLNILIMPSLWNQINNILEIEN
jgi:pimeloyl-ACP methyl ester carboxylesterase